MTETTPSSSSSSRRFRKGHALIRGFARDGAELYITRGEGFEVRGGSPETHAKMLDMARTIMNALRERGFDIDRLSRKEYLEVSKIVREIQDAEPLRSDEASA